MMLDMFDPRLQHFEEFFLPFDVSILFAGTSDFWIFEGWLSIFDFSSGDECEIWMMKEYGVHNS